MFAIRTNECNDPHKNIMSPKRFQAFVVRLMCCCCIFFVCVPLVPALMIVLWWCCSFYASASVDCLLTATAAAGQQHKRSVQIQRQSKHQQLYSEWRRNRLNTINCLFVYICGCMLCDTPDVRTPVTNTQHQAYGYTDIQKSRHIVVYSWNTFANAWFSTRVEKCSKRCSV